MDKKIPIGVLCLAGGLTLMFGLIALGICFPSLDGLLDGLVQPAGWILKYGPGGKEDPLLLLIAIPAQIVTYAAIPYLVVSFIKRVRRGPANKDMSISPKR